MAARSDGADRERVRLARLQAKVNGHCTRDVGRDAIINLTNALDWNSAAVNMALQMWDTFVMAKRNVDVASASTNSTLMLHRSNVPTTLKKGHYAVKKLEIPAIVLHVQQIMAMSTSTDAIVRLTDANYNGRASVRRVVHRLDRMRREMKWPIPAFYTRVLGSAMQALNGLLVQSDLATMLMGQYLEEIRTSGQEFKEVMTRFDVAGATLAAIAASAWSGMQSDLRICTSRVSPQRRQWRTPPANEQKTRITHQVARNNRKKRKRDLDVVLDERAPKRQEPGTDDVPALEPAASASTTIDRDIENWTWACHRKVASSTWRVYTNQWYRYLPNSSVRTLAHEAARRSKF